MEKNYDDTIEVKEIYQEVDYKEKNAMNTMNVEEADEKKNRHKSKKKHNKLEEEKDRGKK